MEKFFAAPKSVDAAYKKTDIDANREELSAGIAAKLGIEFSKIGFVNIRFRIEGTSFYDDTMRRINRSADTSAEAQPAQDAGFSYSQIQQLAALRDAAKK